MAYDFNNTELKTNRAVQSKARELAFDILLQAFTQANGADNVSIVGNNTIAVNLGLRTISDGTQSEVCVEISPKAKDFDYRTTAKNTFEPYERLACADAYEEEKTEKERKAEEKARKKAEKMEKDKKAREAAKAKKQAEKQAEETEETEIDMEDEEEEEEEEE